jgi:predicted transcriptional regulator
VRKSCIVQRKNSRLVVLHEDYIEICDGNMIAAMILSILIYWTDVKLAQREQEQEQRKATGEDIPLTPLWIWKSQEGFQHDLLVDKPGMRQVHRSTIATALSLLKDKKFIQARRNPHNNIDRTQQYLIEQDAINEAIKALPDCTIFSTRMSEIVQSNVGNQSMDCTNTDNGLPNFRQTIPENTNRDYDTEITEQREREVATATARSQSSSQNDLSEDDEDTVEREAVKPSQKDVARGHHQHRTGDNHLPAHSDLPDPVQPEHRKDTNKITEPPAPRKPRSNPTIPKRPRPQQQELTDEIPGPDIPEKAVAIMDRWDRVHKKPAPRTIKTIQAAQLLMVYDPSEDELRECEKWLYTTDRPGKPWYRSHGVHLPDIAEKIGSWQSLQNAPPPKPEKEESNEHKAAGFYSNGALFERNKAKTEAKIAEALAWDEARRAREVQS